MTIILFNAGGKADGSSDILPAANFELAGVFDIGFAMSKFGPQAAMDFLQKNHPRVAPVELIGHGPRWMVSVDQAAKDAGANAVPFGIFLATKDINPHHAGPLRTSAELRQYADSVKVLLNDSSWKTWDDVVSHFCNQTEHKSKNFNKNRP